MSDYSLDVRRRANGALGSPTQLASKLRAVRTVAVKAKAVASTNIPSTRKSSMMTPEEAKQIVTQSVSRVTLSKSGTGLGVNETGGCMCDSPYTGCVADTPKRTLEDLVQSLSSDASLWYKKGRNNDEEREPWSSSAPTPMLENEANEERDEEEVNKKREVDKAMSLLKRPFASKSASLLKHATQTSAQLDRSLRNRSEEVPMHTITVSKSTEKSKSADDGRSVPVQSVSISESKSRGDQTHSIGRKTLTVDTKPLATEINATSTHKTLDSHHKDATHQQTTALAISPVEQSSSHSQSGLKAIALHRNGSYTDAQKSGHVLSFIPVNKITDAPSASSKSGINATPVSPTNAFQAKSTRRCIPGCGTDHILGLSTPSFIDNDCSFSNFFHFLSGNKRIESMSQEEAAAAGPAEVTTLQLEGTLSWPLSLPTDKDALAFVDSFCGADHTREIENDRLSISQINQSSKALNLMQTSTACPVIQRDMSQDEEQDASNCISISMSSLSDDREFMRNSGAKDNGNRDNSNAIVDPSGIRYEEERPFDALNSCFGLAAETTPVVPLKAQTSEAKETVLAKKPEPIKPAETKAAKPVVVHSVVNKKPSSPTHNKSSDTEVNETLIPMKNVISQIRLGSSSLLSIVEEDSKSTDTEGSGKGKSPVTKTDNDSPKAMKGVRSVDYISGTCRKRQSRLRRYPSRQSRQNHLTSRRHGCRKAAASQVCPR
jgi:hypothetical protein